MAEKKKGSAAEGYFAKYKANKTWEKNRIRKLQKTLKAQPNNEQVKTALKCIVYRRKTPGDHGWSASEIHTAKLFKMFTGTFDRSFFNADPKVSQAWIQAQSPAATNYVNLPGPKSFFSIEARSNLTRKG